ncbi:MAG: hypothetical protein CMN30_15885 [Sandaracinus sp.]|nr:hypothetical protein [Sandaracinus sp.]
MIARSLTLVAALAPLSACSGAVRSEGTAAPSAVEPSAVEPSAVEPSADEVSPKGRGNEAREPAEPEVVADCEGDLPVFADGARTEASVCAESESFTPVSLSDEWTPQLFDEDPSLGARGRQPYRETYLALANERFDEMNDPNSERRYLELYGIFPTPSLLAARLGDDERHACHDAIDDSALEGFDSTIRFRWDPEMRGRFARRHERREAHLERILESEDDLDEPADLAEHPEYDDFYERYVSSRNAYEALRTTQRHLECDGLLEEGHFEEGALDGPTMRALRAFQRKEMIVGRGHLDPETAAALAMDSREQDFRAVLRMLRERVVDATGLIEDGSASHEYGRVLGRQLDPPEMRFTSRQPAAPNGAPDRISAATEAAARALGLTSPEAARERLADLPERVALPLPEVPEYRTENGDQILWAEVHTGDPARRYDAGSGEAVRPVVTLWTMDGDDPVALIRWPTTVGGFKEAKNSAGHNVTRHFPSPTGRFVWKDVVASPAWLAPPSTPDEVLTLGQGSNWRPNHDLIGPGYESAYGLAMIIHEKPRQVDGEDGESTTDYLDQGIRSHGSVSYHSITHGSSHGCHRLYNHLAVRLAGHLVAHRQHVRHGNEEVRFHRVIRHAGKTADVSADSRGYFYEIQNPVPVLVLEGRAEGPSDEPAMDEALRPSAEG